MSVFSQSTSPLPLDQNGRTVAAFRYMASGNGTVTTSGTAVAIKNTATEAKAIDIINPTTNADIIVIGDSTVSYASLKGIPIEPGFTYRLQVTDLSKIFVDAAGNGYTFSYNYFY